MKKIYWIDDKSDFPGKSIQADFKKELDFTFEPYPIKKSEEFDELISSDGFSSKTVAAIIMDYNLPLDVGPRKMEYGTTWAVKLRAKHPNIPIIGVSQDAETKIPRFRIENYLYFFPRGRLLSDISWSFIKAIINGYLSLTSIKASSNQADKLIQLIDPPDRIHDLLARALPDDARIEWDPETPHSIGRWMLYDFIERPGFLIDKIGLETMLGISHNSMSDNAWERVESKLDQAEYTGIFSCNERKRWWECAIRPTIEQLIPQEEIFGPISEYRESILRNIGFKRIPTNWFSKPHARKDSTLIPEVVAYKDELKIEDDRVQCMFCDVKADETELNPPFGFRPRMIFKGI